MLMIPIDTGNKAIKTENFEFHSGITALESMPGENEEALMFQDKYYRLSHERNVYLPDKTLDDRYYLLTLFAIAKELEKLRQSRPFIPGELISMDLVVGLPPLYYRSQYKKFRDYFYREGRLVHCAYMGRSYRLTFSNVYVHMQTYIEELDLMVVKRILAIEGDVVSIDESGVYVNGKKAAESVDMKRTSMEFIVTANQYFLIGDNMMDSLDSRIWGCIGRSAVQGIVIKKLF